MEDFGSYALMTDLLAEEVWGEAEEEMIPHISRQGC